MAAVTEEQILARVKEVMRGFGRNLDDVQPDARFEDLDVDSLDIVELGQVIEEEYGVELTAEDAKGLTTVQQLIDIVVQRASAATA